MSRPVYSSVFLFTLAVVIPASAQETGGVTGAGVGVAGVGLFDDGGRRKVSSGVAAWLDLTPIDGVSIESRVSWFPGREFPEYESQGGRTLSVQAGVRGTFYEGRQLRLQGVAYSGVVRFSGTATGEPDGQITLRPRTRLSMAWGLGIEARPRSRWAPRFDFVHMLYVVPGTTLYQGASGGGAVPSAVLDARIADTFQFTAGLHYRPGRRPAPQRTESNKRFSAGPQFVHAVAGRRGDLTPFHDGGIND